MNESADDAYPAGPLMKGRTVQMAATDSTNRFLDAAMLQNTPPVGYDRNDQTFAQSGGPEIYPGAMWETTDPVTVYNMIGGNPQMLAQAALQFVNLYAELTGVMPARTGQRTASHTTAYAKNAELQRSAMRTQDYVDQTGNGPVTNWLHIAYRMGLDAIKGMKRIPVFIPEYGGYVEIDSGMLPEDVTFEWFGANGPADKQQKQQLKLQSFEMAMKMDQAAVQMGKPPTVNIANGIKEVLREGGWLDLEAIINVQTQQQPGGAPGGAAAPPGVPGTGGGGGMPSPAALQGIAGGRGR
jgi:hypothetical protein